MHRPGAMGHSEGLNDHRILDPKESGMLGQVFDIRADVSTVAIDPIASNTLVVDQVRPNEVGSTSISRKLNGRKLSARNQHNPSIITMALESVMTAPQPLRGVGHAQETILQGMLKFGSGGGQQGQQPSIDFSGNIIDGDIIFDIDTGVMLSFPAAFFQLDFLYTSVCLEGFTLGDIIGPNLQTTFSLGYEPQVHLGEVTMTRLCHTRDLAVAGIEVFSRPKYSSSVYFEWFNWNNVGFSPIGVSFTNMNGEVVWSIVYTNADNPPKIIPWPADAINVVVTNTSPGILQFLKAVNILEF